MIKSNYLLKHVFLFFISGCILLSPLSAMAEGENDILWNRLSYEKKVTKIGQRLLKSNQIKELITFRVHNYKAVNAYSEGSFSVIGIDKALLRYIENDDELAAILAHEIVHITESHAKRSKFKRIGAGIFLLPPLYIMDFAMAMVCIPPFLSKRGKRVLDGLTKDFEFEADSKALDLMVQADYNPAYMEYMLKKITSDGDYFNIYRSHPKGSERITRVHSKLVEKYPNSLQIFEENEPQFVPINSKKVKPSTYIKDSEIKSMKKSIKALEIKVQSLELEVEDIKNLNDLN